MIPPITPTLVYGSTTFQTTSHVVQPMPYADSFSTGGTISNTSRMTDEMNGNDHHRQDDARREHADAVRRARNSGPRIHRSPNAFCSSGWM